MYHEESHRPADEALDDARPEPGMDADPGERGARRGRKERILHTRISEDLADDLRRVAEDLRVPVSNLVRNVLEEAFSVVEAVTDNVGELIEDVMDEAEAVRDRIRVRQRRRSAGASRGPAPAREAEAPERAGLGEDDVIGWQALLLAGPQRCERCETLLGRGDPAYASVTPKGVGSRWRCEDCLRAA
jgi:hypothetical protein